MKEEHYHETKARDIKSKKFKCVLKDGLKFENEKPINADVIAYCLEKHQQIIKETLESNEDNIYSCDKNNVLLKDIVFEKINDTSSIITYPETQHLLTLFKNLNILTLFPQQEFEAAYFTNKEKEIQSQYATKKHPFISYGASYLSQGYNEKCWEFVKNKHHFNVDKYPLEKVVYKMVSNVDDQNQLWQTNSLNETHIMEEKDFFALAQTNPINPNNILMFDSVEQVNIFLEKQVSEDNPKFNFL
ncbi:hypothetical protein [Rice orange leaf phytoplasma]|uniref:hypothetical protein n=1 Tax=Rice orange leaf phytoplasma TaxID=146897 RepID=UPI0008F5D13E|nr:hypothetical protein [Rice orange leaf phytoplasma]OIJ44958.1 hypothetical protein BHE82_00095 [Rice orange leaf phytoplasma]